MLGLPEATPADAVAVAVVGSAQGDRTVIEVETSHPALVILPNPDYPGWSATVDGQAADIVRVDASFQAVLVPAGSSVVELGFTPSFLGLALFVTAMAVVALAATWRLGDRFDAHWRNSAVRAG